MATERRANITIPARARGNRLDVRRDSRLYASLLGLRRAIEAIVADDLPAGAPLTLVDYGCGNMPYRPVFVRRGVIYLGADLRGNEMADVLVGGDGRVDRPDGSCDIVLSTQVLEHVLNPRRYLEECLRLLRPGGRLILSTHGYWWYHPDPVDFWRWTGEGLRYELEEAGFRVVSLRGVVGLAGAAVQLLQDAVYVRLWKPLRAPFAFVMQTLIRLFDRLHSDNDRQREALILVIVGEKSGA